MTVDEAIEILTKIQKKKKGHYPVRLFDEGAKPFPTAQHIEIKLANTYDGKNVGVTTKGEQAGPGICH